MPTPKVTVHARSLRGKKVWEVYHRPKGKKRVRAYFRDKESADQEAQSIREQLALDRQTWRLLSNEDRDEAMAVAVEMKRAGISMRGMWEEQKLKPKSKSPALSVVIGELVAIKKNAGRASDYTDNLKTLLGQFAVGREQIQISAVTLADVESFLDSKNIASRSTLRARLSTLFKFAVRREYRIDNPCTRLETVTHDKGPPRIFTIAEIKSCLEWFKKNPKLFPWFVLSTFCGLRPEEAEKTTKEDIHQKEGWIKIEKQTTKVRQRRVVYPKIEAMALLEKSMKRATLPISPATRRQEYRALAAMLKINPVIIVRKGKNITTYQWLKDITRHTAASYWLADCQSAAAVSESLGNSEKILKRDYKALVTKEQAKTFWETLL